MAAAKKLRRWALAILVPLMLCGGCASVAPRTGDTLQPFTAERPLGEFVGKSELWSKAPYQRPWWDSLVGCNSCLEEVTVTAAKKSDPITNNQEAGIDEGDIVKRVGQYIVLLRRGRLFTFALPTSRDALKAVAYIDVAPPQENIDAWYDEILAYENTVILIGYSFDIEASLIRMFNVASNGELSAGKSYFFKSSDYFDSENYATRLIDDNLVFYLPRDLPGIGEHAVSGEIINGKPENIGNAFSAETVYQPIQQASYPVLHTVATCPLNANEFKCSATSFVGPGSQLFYVSKDAVYLWINSSGRAYDYFLMSDRYVERLASSWHEADDESGGLAIVYRLPIDGGIPGLIEVKGWPVNQFSFRETQSMLQVFARDADTGSGTQPYILDIPLSAFLPQLAQLPPSQYHYLPPLEGESSLSVNRFVGSNFLYSVVEDDKDDRSYVLVKDLDTNQPPMRFELDHSVERIDAVDDIAMIIGTNNVSGLGITPIATGDNPLLGQTAMLDRAVQADGRSHSFNFRRNDSMNIIGFPVIYAPEGEQYNEFWIDNAQDVQMTYFSLTPELGLNLLGEMTGHGTVDDDCKFSCSDWYGDSRPFFIEDKFYALLGYELIEGYMSGLTVQETARVNGLHLVRPLQ